MSNPALGPKGGPAWMEGCGWKAMRQEKPGVLLSQGKVWLPPVWRPWGPWGEGTAHPVTGGWLQDSCWMVMSPDSKGSHRGWGFGGWEFKSGQRFRAWTEDDRSEVQRAGLGGRYHLLTRVPTDYRALPSLLFSFNKSIFSVKLLISLRSWCLLCFRWLLYANLASLSKFQL